MLKDDDIEFYQPSQTGLTLERYKGKVLLVSDSLPTEKSGSNPTVYTSMLLGTGFFKYGDCTMKLKEPVGYERDESAGQGSGVEELWSRRSFWLHPTGFDFTSASVVGYTPSNAEFAQAGNWDRSYARKACPIAFLKSHA